MRFLKCAALGTMILAAAGICSAQQKFPLRAGEWEATMSAPGTQGPPMTMLYCLNDQLWEKALTQNPSCKIQLGTITAAGMSYTMNCDMQLYQMKGKVDMRFEGKEHIVAKSSLEMTMQGKTTTTSSLLDYRWKAAACSQNDANLKAH